jgi:hypothetical protein
LLCSAPLRAQERDRSLERISLALQQQPPEPITGGVVPGESAEPKTFGIFTLVPPQSRGEIIRISVPIGELVSRAFRSAAAAKQRRQEDAARREVNAALKWLADQRSGR